MSQSDNTIPHPSFQTIQLFMKRQQLKNRRKSMSQAILPFAGVFAYSTLLYFSFVWAVNPMGTISRMTYESKLSPMKRFLKRSGPVWIILGGLYGVDKASGLWD